MKENLRTATIIAVLVFFFVSPSLFAQADLQPAAIVKLAKTEPITIREYKEELTKMEGQAKRPLTTDEKRQVLDLMIDERLVLQAAERDRISVSDAETKQQIDQVRLMMSQQLGRELTQTEFESALKKEAGMDFATYKKGVEKQLIAQKFLMAKKRSDFEAMKPPTEEEIQAAYDLNQTKLVRPQTVKASMILVQPDGTAGGEKKAKDLANRLHKEIGSSATKFDEVALRARTPNSGFQADMGAVVPKVPEVQQLFGTTFLSTIFNLRLDEISDVIETPRGYVIVKPIEMYAQKLLGLDDPYQAGTRATVREYLGNQLLQQKQAQVLEKATKDLVAELRKGKPYQIFEKNLGL